MSAKWHVLAFFPLVGLAPAFESQEAARVASATDPPISYVYLLSVASNDPGLPVPEESYQSLSVNPPPTDRPAAQHADLNPALRGYELTDAYKGLVDYSGGSDPKAPQLAGLFVDGRLSVFSAVYRVYDWDWGCNCRGA